MSSSFGILLRQKSASALPRIPRLVTVRTAVIQSQSPRDSPIKDELIPVTAHPFLSIHSTHTPYNYSDSYDEFSLSETVLRSKTRVCLYDDRPLRFKDFFDEIVVGNGI